MKERTLKIFTFEVTLIFFLLSKMFSQQYEYYKDIPKSIEKELKVKISSQFKRVVLSKGYTDKIFSIQFSSEEIETPDVDLQYRGDNEKGVLIINLSDEGTEEERTNWIRKSQSTPGIEPDTWYIKLNNSIPINLEVDLGAGSSNIDISGLILKAFRLSTGVSSTSLVCNEPNIIVMDHLNIEAGLNSFYGGGLGNTNFKNFTFDGGVGSYFIDFSGNIRREANLSIGLVLGSMNIMLPKNVGAQVRYDEGFLSTHTFEDFKKVGEGKYISSNFYNSDGRLNIKIESGVGNVKIKRLER